jgi:hypothetical protein
MSGFDVKTYLKNETTAYAVLVYESQSWIQFPRWSSLPESQSASKCPYDNF